MRLRRTLHETTKWLLTVLATIFFCLFVMSAWWVILWPVAGGRVQATVDWGIIGFREPSGRAPTFHIGWNYGVSLIPKYWRWWFVCRRDLGLINVQIPLWAPFLVTAIPDALMWRAGNPERRRRAGLCPSCAYDRRGLPQTAPCPECGKSNQLR